MSATNQAIFRPLLMGEGGPRKSQNSQAQVDKSWVFEIPAAPQPHPPKEAQIQGFYFRDRAQLRRPMRFREQASHRGTISKADRFKAAATKHTQLDGQHCPYLHLHKRSAMGPLQQ